jgi:hypothetical protein
MHELLAKVVDAHGGAALWAGYAQVEATIVSGGGFFALKGVIQDDEPRQMTVRLREQWASVTPYGADDQSAVFTPSRVAVERTDGSVLAERFAPKDSFAGHQMSTAWDPLHRAYFNGEALWTYLTTPFLLTMPGVRVEEAKPWVEGDETWRVLRAYFPGSLETHEFFFGDDYLLRRHDYRVNIAGGFPAAQLTSEYEEADGIRLPTRRRAFVRGPDGRPVPEMEMEMVWINLTNVRFS